MQKSLAALPKKEADAALVAARNARNIDIVRWYLMIFPYGRKHLTVGLEREIERRDKSGEIPVEYFAPVYVAAKKDADGKIVVTNKPLFENYVFVRASIREIFRLKKFEDGYNLPKREYKSNGEQYYPYVSDGIIQNLRWIANSYSGVIPVYADDYSWLIKGDRIRITSGPFKGIEATLFSHKKGHGKDIMVVIDNWMSVPLLHVKENQYEVIALNENPDNKDLKINDEHISHLHEVLCRKIRADVSPEDMARVKQILAVYANGEPHSDVMRCKLYAILLMAYTILGEAEKCDSLLGIIHVLLPAITAEQSLALLMVTLYGCTDNAFYHEKAHQLLEPWMKEEAPKKSKQLLLTRLADYDRCLGH